MEDASTWVYLELKEQHGVSFTIHPTTKVIYKIKVVYTTTTKSKDQKSGEKIFGLYPKISTASVKVVVVVVVVEYACPRSAY